MEWLDANRQLAGAGLALRFCARRRGGVLFADAEKSRDRLGLKALARVLAVAVGKETKLIKTTEMCLGEGLTACVRGGRKQFAAAR